MPAARPHSAAPRCSAERNSCPLLGRWNGAISPSQAPGCGKSTMCSHVYGKQKRNRHLPVPIAEYSAAATVRSGRFRRATRHFRIFSEPSVAWCQARAKPRGVYPTPPPTILRWRSGLGSAMSRYYSARTWRGPAGSRSWRARLGQVAQHRPSRFRTTVRRTSMNRRYGSKCWVPIPSQCSRLGEEEGTRYRASRTHSASFRIPPTLMQARGAIP